MGQHPSPGGLGVLLCPCLAGGHSYIMTELQPSGVGEHPPSYMIFLVVFLFFLTGLLGFLICHLLKKKGYRCRTGDMDDEEEEEEKIRGNLDDEDEDNQDTVEQILKCIIENEANMEAFNEMLGNHNICARHDPRLRKESIGGVPPHLHTVHSGTDSCHLCAQVRSKKGRRQSRTPRFKQRPGEQTVFSVGRFRVTHTDKKLHGGPNPLASSGDQLDQERSQDSEDKKEGGYNLRSMFKDIRPSSESTNGVAPNVGKRRKSVTIFGLRRGSDPAGIKGVESAVRETGGIKFAISQQPVVVEEPLQADNIHGHVSEPETEPLQNHMPSLLQHGSITASPVISSFSQNEKQAPNSSTENGSKHGPSPEPRTNLKIKPSIGSMVISTPSSLIISNAKDKAFKTEEAFNPGPLQTSTPIVSMPGFIPVMANPQHESYSDTGFPVTQTPPDLSYSQDLEPGLGGNLTLISLGSSPPSSFPIKTPSAASSLKTPTPPLTATPSPKLSSRNTPVEAAKTAFYPALSPSPKLLSNRVLSRQSPIPSSSFGESVSPLQTQSPSPTLSASHQLESMLALSQTFSSSTADPNLSFKSSHQMILKPESPSSLLLKEQELEVRIPKTEIKRAGILKTAKLSPLEGDFHGFALSSPSHGVPTDRVRSLPLSPSSPLSPLSPVGSRISSVTIVKASPDSKREFSVVTMVEDEEFSGGEISDLVVESNETSISPTVGQRGDGSALGTAQPKSQREETFGAKGSLLLHQEKYDMMEMEDIRDCKVMQVQDSKELEDELEKIE